MTQAWKAGERVRVRSDCPHTLPAFAQMLEGVVLTVTEDDHVLVRFGEHREFPIPPGCLDRVTD